jgi:hypothetical protein
MTSRVLLLTPEFYGIGKKIKSVLEESGYEVIWFENKTLPFDYHGTNSKFKFLRRIYFLLFFPHIRYIKKELKKIENTRFDILFSINGYIICSYLFRKLKSKNPGLFSVLYLWDAFSMYSWTRELNHFNKVYTFDSADSEKYRIEYKPNFYVKNFKNRNQEKEYDLFFAGKFNPSRLFMVDKIISQAEYSCIKYFVKLWPAYKIFFHNHLIYMLLKKNIFKSKWTKDFLLNYEAIEGIIKREYLITKSLSYEEMQLHLLCSNVILDLPFQGQTGYTHRLIEALANGKKIITTNSNIKKESFYSSKQIQIMDKQNPEVDCNWIKEKSTFPVNSYFLDLELSAWLKSIINVEIA